VFALLATEAFLALFFPQPGAPTEKKAWAWGQKIHRASDVPGLLYELTPGADKEHRAPKQETPNRILINSKGMRDDEPRAEKTPTLRRIVVLGDSTTFGYGVEAEETYSTVMEELLSEAAPDLQFEALNMGVCGYNTMDEAAVLEYRGLAYEPDLVVIGYNLNDPDAHPTQPLYSYFTDPPLWQYSHLGRLLKDRALQVGIQTLGGGNIIRYWHAPGYDNWAVVENGFRRIAELCKPAGIPVIVVLFTLGNTNDPNGYEYLDLHEQVAREAQADGFAVVDLYPKIFELRSEGIKTQLPHLHPNAAGHRAAAEAIVERILAEPDRFPLLQKR